jgi:hypothetical protein
MKTGLYATILAFVSATVPFATAQPRTSQQGTIISVQKQQVATPSVRTGADPDRTPLQSHYTVYNVSVQLNCNVYVGRYESALDDLPAALSPQSTVPVRLNKNVMYLDFPGDTVKTRIVHHEVSPEGACAQSAPAK